MSAKKQRVIEALAEFATGDVRCDDCGKPASCIGSYEGQEETFPCCDACCGHGNEDGWCVLFDDIDAESVLEFSPAGSVVLTKNQRTEALAAIISSRLRMDAIDDRDVTIKLHVEREKSLEASLVAATNDAARAEIRIHGLRSALRTFLDFAEGEGHYAAQIRQLFGAEKVKGWRSEYAASPDSNERLREVMKRAVVEASKPARWSDEHVRADCIIDEVLRGGA